MGITASDHTQRESQFLKDLIEEISSEARATRDRCHSIWEKPVAERVALGYCIRDITFELPDGSGSPGLRSGDFYHYAVDCAYNPSRFREGDFLRLNRDNPLESDWDVRLVYESETKLEFLSKKEITPAIIEENPFGWCLDQSFLDFGNLYTSAIGELKADSGKHVRHFFTGLAQPTISAGKAQTARALAKLHKLEYSQEEALKEAYMSDLTMMVQGPPGTGKTLLLALLVKLLVADGEKVLVTGLTHRAIDNALNKIHTIDDAIPLVKVEQQSREQESGYPRVPNISKWPMPPRSSGFVVGATPYACWSKQLGDFIKFDSIIFDEASQVTVPLAMLAMLRGKKFFFFGDQQQLPPVAMSESCQGSVFKRVIQSTQVEPYMLDMTFRMNQELTSWPSMAFYDDELIASDLSKNRRLTLPREPERFGPILDPEAVKVLIPSEPGIRRSVNQDEAERVAQLCHQLIACGVTPAEIGIVTPFRAQARCLRRQLKKQLKHHQQEAIVADTVERMQGQERDVVILSLTTTDLNYAKQLLEFYFQPQRLNVSVTRARNKLIIFACPDLAKVYSDKPHFQQWVSQYAELLATCTSLSWTEHYGNLPSP